MHADYAVPEIYECRTIQRNRTPFDFFLAQNCTQWQVEGQNDKHNYRKVVSETDFYLCHMTLSSSRALTSYICYP